MFYWSMLADCLTRLGRLTSILRSIVTLLVRMTVSGSRSLPRELVAKLRSATLWVAVFDIACFTAVLRALWPAGCNNDASHPYNALVNAFSLNNVGSYS